jgi:hypothetical protein
MQSATADGCDVRGRNGVPQRQVQRDEPRTLRATVTVSFRGCAPSSPAPSASVIATAPPD